MPQEFLTQLEQLSQRRQRRRWLTASCWALVALIVVVFCLASLDYLLGVEDRIGRWFLSAALLGSGGAIFARWWRTGKQSAATPLQLAGELENQHPELNDTVSNAWAFAQQSGDDPAAGSEALRRAVVLRASTGTADIDWGQLISRKPLRQAALACAAVAVLVGMFSWWHPQMVRSGLTRLTNPTNTAQWPRVHDLQFVEPPMQLAAGQDLVLQLRDTRGPLPEAITMHYRTSRQGKWQEETQTLASTDDPLEIRRPDIQQSLEYRATGGDHRTMPWHSLEVVPPPRAESVELIVHPPAYAHLPQQPWDKSSPLLAGSQVELQGRTDQAVTSAKLESKHGSEIKVNVTDQGHALRVEPDAWQVTESDTYTLVFTTAAGLTIRSDTELDLDVVADQPPQIRFVQPTQDLTVLPTVAITLVIEATDELALREIALVYRQSGQPDGAEQRLSLWTAGEETNPQQQRVDFSWDLTPLSLRSGDVVEFFAEASDNQPAVGKTAHALRLTIVSEDQLWQQVLADQSRIVETLAELLSQQRALRGITTDWAKLSTWSNAHQANATHSALYRQRQIAITLAEGQGSVLTQIQQLVTTIQRNGVARPEATDRLLTAEGLLRALAENPLPAVEQSLSEITRQAQRAAEQAMIAPLLTDTAEQQDAVIGGLRQVLDLLLPSDVVGLLESELAEIEKDQRELAEHCRVEIAPLVFKLGADQSDTRAILSSAVRQQRELAGRFAELLLRMSQQTDRLTDDEPTLVARLAETLALAEQLHVQSTMLSAADQLAQRRLGRSASYQQQVLEALAKLLRRLAGRDVANAAERFEQLQSAERKLERLRRQVAALERELSKPTPAERQQEIERLRRAREALAQQTEALARKLEQLRLPRAAEAAKQAASQLRRATLDSETAKSAAGKLAAAKRQLTAARRRQQVALARLEMAQLDVKLKALVARQQSVAEEVHRLHVLRDESGQLNEPQRQSVQLLSRRQADLRDEATIQAENLSTLPVFEFLLRQSAQSMQAVEMRLQAEQLDTETQQLVAQALDQLTELSAALRQEQQELAANKRPDDGAGQGAGDGNAGDKDQEQTLQLNLGQLKLLKSLQLALREQTQALEAQQAAGESPTQRAAELARQQQELTELARQLVPEPPDPPAEKLFPNLEEELLRSLDDISLPRPNEEHPP